MGRFLGSPFGFGLRAENYDFHLGLLKCFRSMRDMYMYTYICICLYSYSIYISYFHLYVQNDTICTSILMYLTL